MAAETKESVELKTSSTPQNYGSSETKLIVKKDESINDMKQQLLPKRNNENKSNKKKAPLRFADPSQLKATANPRKGVNIVKKMEKEAITQTSHGKCDTSNFIMDFQMDIGTIYPPRCRIVNGWKSGKLSVAQRKSIKNIIFKIWQNSQYLSNIKCCVKYRYLILVLVLIGIVAAVIILTFTVTDNDSYLAGLLTAIFGPIIGWILWILKLRIEGFEFRAQFLMQMTKYMDTKLKQQYPDLLFTLIYPIKMEGAFNCCTAIRNDIWCYLRISEGIIDLDDFEPLYHRTCNDEEEEFSEWNEHCRLPATAKSFGDSLNIKNIAKAASFVGKYGNSAVDAFNSATSIISSFR